MKKKTNLSNRIEKIFSRFPILPWLLLIILLMGILGFTYYEKKPREIDTNDPSTVQLKQDVKTIATLQKHIITHYQGLSLDRPTKIKVFYELMGPLGALDPIAKPETISDNHALVNYIYGYNFRAFDFPEEEAGYSATAPIRYESNFDEQGFYNDYKKQLNSLVETVQTDEDLEILGLGYTGIYRINNYFGDPERDFYWKLVQNDSPFYSYETLNETTPDEYEKNKELKDTYNALLGQLAILQVQSVYECEGKVIVTVDALADNGFGYIYNATSGEEVNCGLLTNRFRIVKDTPIDDKWRFWASK